MELIAFIFFAAFCVDLHLRDRREKKRRASLPSKEITITILINRDNAGRIQEIRVA